LISGAPPDTQTSDRRLRIGGWAALLVAVLAPVQLVALFVGAREPDPFTTGPVLLLGAVRIAAAMTAIVGLDVLFRSIAPDPARLILRLGVTGATVALALDLLAMAGVAIAGAADTALGLVANALLGVWFIGGGAILMSRGNGLARVGWTAELGGAGTIVGAILIAFPFGGSIGTGQSWIDWFLLLGLFVVVYLVRVWQYVVRGRLPGPGIL
jgi:hypothetical protein